jgi:hypothetical protein
MRGLFAIIAMLLSASVYAGETLNAGGTYNWKRDMQSLRNERGQQMEIRTNFAVDPNNDQVMLAWYTKEADASVKKGCPENSNLFTAPTNQLPDVMSSDVRTIRDTEHNLNSGEPTYLNVFTATFDLSKIFVNKTNSMFLICYFDFDQKEVFALRAPAQGDGMQVFVTGNVAGAESAPAWGAGGGRRGGYLIRARSSCSV